MDSSNWFGPIWTCWRGIVLGISASSSSAESPVLPSSHKPTGQGFVWRGGEGWDLILYDMLRGLEYISLLTTIAPQITSICHFSKIHTQFIFAMRYTFFSMFWCWGLCDLLYVGENRDPNRHFAQCSSCPVISLPLRPRVPTNPCPRLPVSSLAFWPLHSRWTSLWPRHDCLKPRTWNYITIRYDNEIWQ